LHRETTGLFYYRNTLSTGVADGQFFFGNPGDRFVAGDWGVVDGADTPAMFRPANSTFYFRYTLTQGNADSHFIWPITEPNWIPVSVDTTSH
jgi:lactocepin